MSFSSHVKRSDFHLGESQRVPGSAPVPPLDTITARRCVVAGVVVDAVQVGVMTAGAEPPATFVRRHSTRA